MSDPFTVKLSKEVVNSKGEKVTCVSIKEPTGRDLEDLGLPVIDREIEEFDTSTGKAILKKRTTETHMDFEVVAQYLDVLADVPLDALRAQPAIVMRSCGIGLMAFLVPPDEKTTS